MSPGRQGLQHRFSPAARSRTPPGSRLTCAVSGGADSLALLVLATAAGCEVTAVHVDHGLRPGSATEAAAVEQAAQPSSARASVALRVEVGPGPNLEARARDARRAVLPARRGYRAHDGRPGRDRAAPVAQGDRARRSRRP